MKIGIGKSLGAYRELLKIRGAPGFVIAGLIGRFPISMRALAAMLLVLAATGSYATAGAIGSVVTLSNAFAVPALGRLSDRRGQRWLIFTALIVHAGGLIALVLLTRLGAPLWTLFAAAAVFGASGLPLGSLVRARWTALVGGTPRQSTAYALEAFIDDIIYLTGPVIVTLLAGYLAPTASMLVILGMVLVGWTALALQRSTQPELAPVPAGPRRGAISEPGLRALLLVCLALGAWLGASNVALVAFADEQGNRSLGGILIGLTILGGMIAGLVYGGITWNIPLVRRLLGTAVLLGVGTLPLIFAASFWWMVPFAVIAGLAITPTLIGIYSVLSNVVPKSSVTEGFAWIASSIAVGSSAGVAVSGWLVERFDSRSALIFMAAAGLLSPLVVAVNERLLGRTPHAEVVATGAPDRVPVKETAVSPSGE
ncbi:MFS transporter [Micromonospora sp. KC723]|uniref:MFS transporter n=1 Tax=Micromonospora sp. KC723 TaxID=2530381 RepID=UPI001050327A|nr:MFS transporter [Micromonospora sp. KC723]TDB78458.1 MFS transporter [Micromonospora sp. KC723]